MFGWFLKKMSIFHLFLVEVPDWKGAPSWCNSESNNHKGTLHRARFDCRLPSRRKIAFNDIDNSDNSNESTSFSVYQMVTNCRHASLRNVESVLNTSLFHKGNAGKSNWWWVLFWICVTMRDSQFRINQAAPWQGRSRFHILHISL